MDLIMGSEKRESEKSTSFEKARISWTRYFNNWNATRFLNCWGTYDINMFLKELNRINVLPLLL